MKLSPRALALIVELAKRRPVAALVEDAADTEECAARLRAWMYPKQAAFFARAPKHQRRFRATTKTRRSGATAGGVREFLARAIEQPGFRATYVTSTAKEARERAWENDTNSGFVQVLRQEGDQLKHRSLECIKLGGVKIDIRDGDLKLEFSNDSMIELIGADTVGDHNKRRGVAKHVIWPDEAQDFPLLLEFFDAVVIGSLTDYVGECWLTGTPGRDCAGMFYDVTKDPADGEEPLPNWDVHLISSSDNPFFGRVVLEDDRWFVVDNVGEKTGPYHDEREAEAAAVEVRWERTVGDAKRAKNWNGTEPDFIREWCAKWVKTDARYVYPVHSVPRHRLLFAPQRLADNPFVGSHQRFDAHPRWYDHQAAVRDLPMPPRGRKPYTWMFGVAADFGFRPDPFALVVTAFCYELPDVYEMFSWKCTEVHSDDQAAYLRLLLEAVDPIVSFVGDAANKGAEFAVWQTRMNLPIEEANKQGKNMLEELLADDIRRERVHLRENSPLHLEMKHLVYLPTKPGRPREVHKHRKVNGVVHGDHCADAMRYGFNDLRHFLAKIEPEKPPPGSAAEYAAVAERHERRIENEEARRVSEALDRLEDYGDGGYGYQ